MGAAINRRHARHLDEKRVRHSHELKEFATAQDARLSTGSVSAVAALGALNMSATNPSDGQTVVIGTKTYTFQTSLTEADGHVKIAASAALSATNLFHAINKSGGVAGTDYANAMVANADFTATNPSSGVVDIAAKVAGVRTDATTTNVTGASWGAATVTGGVNAASAYSFDTLDALKRNSADEIANASTHTALR